MKRKIVGFAIFLALFMGLANNFAIDSYAYETPITVSGAWIAIDIYHGGYHTTADELDPFIGNLTAAGNHVAVINETWYLTDNISALFLPGNDVNYTAQEMEDIKRWLGLGDKLLVVAGDSDYGGYFDPWPLNNLLDYLDTKTRLDATSISDSVNNDGASYRVGVKDFGDGPIAQNLTKGMQGGFILHGPCSILGFDGTYYKDLRESSFNDVEVVVYYSENSTSTDSDVSESVLDLYATKEATGNYPAVVYEHLRFLNGSHMIIAGEAFFTHYKKMYDQTTEEGKFQGGVTYGQMFTHNIINQFVKPYVPPEEEEGSFPVIVPFVALGVLYAVYRIRRK